MSYFTIYTDESGQFHHPTLELGLHVTVAAVVRLTSVECTALLTPALETVAAPLGLPFHASECTFGSKIAKRLQRRLNSEDLIVSERLRAALVERPPPRFWMAPENVDFDRELKAIGSKAIVRVRRAVGGFLTAHDGFAVLCFQQGNPEPRQDRWREMMLAVMENALTRIAQLPDGPHHIEIFPAERGDSNGRFDLRPHLMALDAARSRGAGLSELVVPNPGAVKVVAADLSVGVQLADVIAHSFGPGPGAHRPTLVAERFGMDINALRGYGVHYFSLPKAGRDRLTAGGARPETHGEVAGAIADWSGAPESHGALHVQRMSRLAAALKSPAALPPHTMRCAVEGSLGVVRALGAREGIA